MRSINYYIHIIIIGYLTFLGFIYLLHKYCFSNYRGLRKSHNFKDKHVCIIGASEGLGLSLAKEILKEKPKILTLMSRNEKKLRNAKRELDCLVRNVKDTDVKESLLGVSSIRINIIKCDLGKVEDVEDALKMAVHNCSLDNKEINEKMLNGTILNGELSTKLKDCEIKNSIEDPGYKKEKHPIDVLICNAAYVWNGEVKNMNPLDINSTVNVNITGNIFSIQRVLLDMIRRNNGLIVIINSECCLYPIYGFSLYAMSKMSMWSFSHILEQEIKHANIQVVNAFLPTLETPGYITELKSKPSVTKKIEDNLTSTLNSDYAASRVIEKIKKGRKFITLHITGYMLSILHGGYRNPESYFDYLIQVTFAGFFFFVSSIYKLYIEYMIKINV